LIHSQQYECAVVLMYGPVQQQVLLLAERSSELVSRRLEEELPFLWALPWLAEGAIQRTACKTYLEEKSCLTLEQPGLESV
jgi:hypothetical protein